MAVDLTKLPDDEETVRATTATLPSKRSAIQNVLDGLNFYRCKALHDEQALRRVEAELIEVRNSSHHNRIFGGSYGLSN